MSSSGPEHGVDLRQHVDLHFPLRSPNGIARKIINSIDDGDTEKAIGLIAQLHTLDEAMAVGELEAAFGDSLADFEESLLMTAFLLGLRHGRHEGARVIDGMRTTE